MFITFRVNRTSVELNTGGSLWVETARRQIHAFSRAGGLPVPLREDLEKGERVREGFDWVLISSPRC